MPTFGSLFAGIGGIDLGLERAGWECRFQVEWDAFCQRVLAKHWPDVPRYGDIHDVHGPLAHTTGIDERDDRPEQGGSTPESWPASGLAGSGRQCQACLPPVDLLAGGFPCQPFSVAGKQRRLDDDRWLWPEFARAIRELRPRYVLVENVPGLLVGGGMDAVLGDLASLGYDAEWESIPAAAVGAPHLRYRVWIVGYRRELRPLEPVPDTGNGGLWVERERQQASERLNGGASLAGHDGADGPLADADSAGSQGRPVQPQRLGERAAGAGGVADAAGGRRERGRTAPRPEDGGWALGLSAGPSEGDEPSWWEFEPDVGRVAHGVPARVDRLRSLGNAVVPQVVEVIGRALREAYDAA